MKKFTLFQLELIKNRGTGILVPALLKPRGSILSSVADPKRFDSEPRPAKKLSGFRSGSGFGSGSGAGSESERANKTFNKFKNVAV